MTDARKALLRAVVLALEAAERDGLSIKEGKDGVELHVELEPLARAIVTKVRSAGRQITVAVSVEAMENRQLGVRL